MSVKSLQLKGNNLCNIECVNKNSVIHPETDIKNIITNESSEQTLEDWLLYDYHNPSTPFDSINSGLLEWLETNYPIPSIELPVASTETLGAIKVGEFLKITDNEVLNVDKDSLGIPDIGNATYNRTGVLKIGNSTPLSSAFNDSTISYLSSQLFPLRVDNNGRAGIEIDNAVFTNLQVQSDWDQLLSNQPDYIKNKPNLAKVALTGNYSDLLNKPESPSTNIIVDNWMMGGLSQHYFNITKQLIVEDTESYCYIPLFKVEIGWESAFRINLRFQIIGRYEATYYGDYIINYNNDSGFLMTLHNVSNSTTLESSDIIVAVSGESALTYKIIVYKKTMLSASRLSTRDLINPESFIINMININTIYPITYYCSTKIKGNSNEILLDSEEDQDSSIINPEDEAPTSGVDYID